MKRILFLSGVMVILSGLTTMTGATPIGELHDNLDGTFTDHDTDLMWLSDANLGMGSVFDDGFDTMDGKMTWASANTWAASLTVGGYNDWRLPATLQPDASCGDQTAYGGFLDQGSGTGCTGSEMGHLFNVEGVSPSVRGPFNNVQNDFYWSSTEFAPGPRNAWFFDFTDFSRVGQGANGKDFNYFAWAVRSVDVFTVPEPSTLALIGLGLAGLGFARRKKAA